MCADAADERPELARLHELVEKWRRIAAEHEEAGSLVGEYSHRSCADELDAALRASRSGCTDYAPVGHTGHWREWHRGHGCNLDPADAALRASQGGRPKIDYTNHHNARTCPYCQASAPCEGVPEKQMPLRAEEPEVVSRVSGPPQRTTGDASTPVPEEKSRA